MSQFKMKIAAIAAPLGLVAAVAFAPVSAQEYLSDSQGEVVRNSYNECWEVSYGLPECDGRKMVFTGVLFDFDRATIKPEFATQLNDLSTSLSASGYNAITVEGHTDSIGSESYNQSLSERRANAVADYLTGRGLDRSKIKAFGVGEANPVAPNDTPANRYLNRRVEISVN